MHLKDYTNGKYMAGYCPLGMGFVDLESILNTRKKRVTIPMSCASSTAPMSARDTAEFDSGSF